MDRVEVSSNGYANGHECQVPDPIMLNGPDPAQGAAAIVGEPALPAEGASEQEPAEPALGGAAAITAGRAADGWPQPMDLSTMPAAAAMPLEIFPEKLRAIVGCISSSVHAPADYAVSPMLAIIGASLGNAVEIEMKEGWRERAIVWTNTIAKPGRGKSACYGKAIAPLYREQERRLDRHKRLAKKKGVKEEDLPFDGVFVGNSTVRAVTEALCHSSRGLLLARDELTGFYEGFNQYDRGQSDGAFYMALWDGKEPVYYLRSRERLYARRPFLCLTGNVPPRSLPRLRALAQCGDGLWQRILFAFPDPWQREGEDWKHVPRTTQAAWARIVHAVRNVQPVRDSKGRIRPRVVRLKRSARDVYEKISRRLAEVENDDSYPESIQGHFAKFYGYCARLALILHCLEAACEGVDPSAIDGPTMANAGKLIEYFGAHAARVHASMGHNPQAALASLLWGWVERKIIAKRQATFTVRNAHMGIRRRADDQGGARAVKRAINFLVGHGYCRASSTGTKSEVYEINPVLSGARSMCAMRAMAGQDEHIAHIEPIERAPKSLLDDFALKVQESLSPVDAPDWFCLWCAEEAERRAFRASDDPAFLASHWFKVEKFGATYEELDYIGRYLEPPQGQDGIFRNQHWTLLERAILARRKRLRGAAKPTAPAAQDPAQAERSRREAESWYRRWQGTWENLSEHERDAIRTHVRSRHPLFGSKDDASYLFHSTCLRELEERTACSERRLPPPLPTSDERRPS